MAPKITELLISAPNKRLLAKRIDTPFFLSGQWLCYLRCTKREGGAVVVVVYGWGERGDGLNRKSREKTNKNWGLLMNSICKMKNVILALSSWGRVTLTCAVSTGSNVPFGHPSVLAHTALLDTPYCAVGILHLSLLLHNITICNTSISLDVFIECVTFKGQRSNVKSYISTHAYNKCIFLILSPPWSIITPLMAFIGWLLHLLPLQQIIKWKKWNLHMIHQSIQLEIHHTNVSSDA